MSNIDSVKSFLGNALTDAGFQSAIAGELTDDFIQNFFSKVDKDTPATDLAARLTDAVDAALNHVGISPTALQFLMNVLSALTHLVPDPRLRAVIMVIFRALNEASDSLKGAIKRRQGAQQGQPKFELDKAALQTKVTATIEKAAERHQFEDADKLPVLARIMEGLRRKEAAKEARDTAFQATLRKLRKVLLEYAKLDHDQIFGIKTPKIDSVAMAWLGTAVLTVLVFACATGWMTLLTIGIYEGLGKWVVLEGRWWYQAVSLRLMVVTGLLQLMGAFGGLYLCWQTFEGYTPPKDEAATLDGAAVRALAALTAWQKDDQDELRAVIERHGLTSLPFDDMKAAKFVMIMPLVADLRASEYWPGWFSFHALHDLRDAMWNGSAAKMRMSWVVSAALLAGIPAALLLAVPTTMVIDLVGGASFGVYTLGSNLIWLSQNAGEAMRDLGLIRKMMAQTLLAGITVFGVRFGFPPLETALNKIMTSAGAINPGDSFLSFLQGSRDTSADEPDRINIDSQSYPNPKKKPAPITGMLIIFSVVVNAVALFLMLGLTGSAALYTLRQFSMEAGITTLAGLGYSALLSIVVLAELTRNWRDAITQEKKENLIDGAMTAILRSFYVLLALTMLGAMLLLCAGTFGGVVETIFGAEVAADPFGTR